MRFEASSKESSSSSSREEEKSEGGGVFLWLLYDGADAGTSGNEMMEMMELEPSFIL